MYCLDVSIIILTYNPEIDKLVSTLKSAIRQKDCDYEIIISDDGSSETYEEYLKDFFEKEGVQNYRILNSEYNEGTIKNYLKALKHARGKYTFGISPGDLFHDDEVIKDLFDFCENRDISICFGDAEYYSIKGDAVILYNGLCKKPVHPSLFENKNTQKHKIAFLFGNYIIGATYFRKTSIAKQYIGMISDCLKYAEDTPSTLLALADGIPVMHIQRSVIWYDYKSGISNGDARWQAILNKEYDITYRLVQSKHPDDRVINAAVVTRKLNNKMLRVLYRVIFHPYISLVVLMQKFSPVSTNDAMKQKSELSSIYMKDIIGDKYHASC